MNVDENGLMCANFEESCFDKNETKRRYQETKNEVERSETANLIGAMEDVVFSLTSQNRVLNTYSLSLGFAYIRHSKTCR